MRFLESLVFTLCITHSLALIQSPPRMVKQPPTDEILFQVAINQNENDKPFIIECEAEGEPAPRYRWIKNGKPFEWQTYDDRISQQPGRGTLVITIPREEDIGQYQCFATNEWGTATSNSVFVRKAELNSFKSDEEEETLDANEGEPFKLKCQPPDGWPKPEVHWLIQSEEGGIKSINSSRITLDPEGTLWFSNVTRDDASQDASYACSATSRFRNEYKIGNRVKLNVVATGTSAAQNRHEPVQQYVTRKNEVAYLGRKVELFCIFGGTPLPQIRWTKRGGPLQHERVTQNNYGKSLVIKHANFEDEGDYSCEASNGVGSAKSYSIKLSVLAAPYFTKEPQTVSAAEDETIEFNCEAKGVPEPQIKWVYNGMPIEQAPVNSRRRILQNKIIIERLVKGDTGNYGCNATNSIGYVYKDVYVNVLALAPEITEAPNNISVVNDKDATLTCRVFGAPKPLVKWIRGGTELTGGRYKIKPNGDLTISKVNFLDAGDYICHATNKFGKDEKYGSLTVKERTRITDAPEDYEVAAGMTATFRCNAVSDPSLKMVINWLNNNQQIDFEAEPRFVISTDYSLTITKTNELDSGTYTCVAVTDLDSESASATLTVQDVPNPPRLKGNGARCSELEASVSWEPRGDNRAPIVRYTIQYNTSFTPDSWDIAAEKVPATESTYSVPLSPWSNYTFRVIAWNKIGQSLPSPHSSVCTTQPAVPAKNPDNVEGKGDQPDNLVISWTQMPEIDHNAPRFQYRVMWLRDIPGEQWQSRDISDWTVGRIVVPNQPTYQPYKIKVVAINEKGQANVAAQEVRGYSGEDSPIQAPRDFNVTVIDSTSALLSWEQVTDESVRGEFKGYKIQTWTDKEGIENMREIHVAKDNSRALINKFIPYSKNFVRIMAYNGRFNGPPSETLSFNTPEGTPGSVASLEAHPLGSSAFLLKWQKPLQTNGVLTGYRIYYQPVTGTKVGPLVERKPITEPKQLHAKLAGLDSNTKYRIHIKATTRAGEGNGFFVEANTLPAIAKLPDTPQFRWKNEASDNGLSNIRVVWLPNVEGHPGSHFTVKYRIRGEPMFEETDPQLEEDYIIVRGLKPGETYEMQVVAVDGDHISESKIQEVETYSDGPIIQPRETVATAGWFIGMMLAIAVLLLVLIIVCIVKRNRGGKYAVHEREVAHGRSDYPEEGFHEYSQPLDGGKGRGSLSSDAKGMAESDTDSMAEYGEGDAGMNEDGSFIGQYGRKKAQQRLLQIQQEEAAAAAAAAAAANKQYGGGFATVV
ncbi:neuroglian isoform X2 [Neocloeon triangulifer]|uniref:neuroglian isoform X2 n=1 Tax=Neocloeon triangulifer TaxID=2078957 RepID=UPI00286EC911|nr:neuroglian isoform X2 [Neocloeon triangulifer]